MSDEMGHVTTSALEYGWYARLASDGGKEKITLFNPDRAQRIDLNDESVKLLRELFAATTIKAGG